MNRTHADTWAVMTAYRPTLDLVEHAKAALIQCAGAIVVDDGSGPEFSRVWSALESAGCIVLRSPENRGIAAALNTGIADAEQRGARYVLTLDQDSAIPDDFVARLHDVAEPLGDVVVVPEFFAGVRQADRPRTGAISVTNAIQSGMLVPIRVSQRVGPLREDFFIDLVDTEFVLRCRARGVRVLAAPGLRLDHSLGMQVPQHVFWLRLPGTLTVSAPFRYYYRARNRMALNRAYRGRFRLQRMKGSVADAIHFIRVVATSTPSRAMIRLLWRGVSDGRRGSLGRMDSALAPVAAEIRWRSR